MNLGLVSVGIGCLWCLCGPAETSEFDADENSPGILYVAQSAPRLLPADATTDSPDVPASTPADGRSPWPFEAMGSDDEPDYGGTFDEPGLLFGGLPIGSGVRREVPPQSPETSATLAPTGEPPIVRRRLPAPAGLEPPHIAMTGANGFVAGAEQEFQLRVANPNEQEQDPFFVTLRPHDGFRLTVLDRAAHVDSQTGAVTWRVERLPSGAVEVIQFRAVAHRGGQLIHEVIATDDSSTLARSRFLTRVHLPRR